MCAVLRVRGSQGIKKYPNVLFSRINFIDLFTNFLCIKLQVVALRLGFGFVKSGVIYRIFTSRARTNLWLRLPCLS